MSEPTDDEVPERTAADYRDRVDAALRAGHDPARQMLTARRVRWSDDGTRTTPVAEPVSFDEFADRAREALSAPMTGPGSHVYLPGNRAAVISDLLAEFAVRLAPAADPRLLGSGRLSMLAFELAEYLGEVPLTDAPQ